MSTSTLPEETKVICPHGYDLRHVNCARCENPAFDASVSPVPTGKHGTVSIGGTPPEQDITVDQMLGVAQWLERVSVREVVKEVNAIAKDRTDGFWAGHSTACEEILHRLAALWGRPDDPEWKLP